MAQTGQKPSEDPINKVKARIQEQANWREETNNEKQDPSTNTAPQDGNSTKEANNEKQDPSTNTAPQNVNEGQWISAAARLKAALKRKMYIRKALRSKWDTDHAS